MTTPVQYTPKYTRDRRGKWTAEATNNFVQVVAGSDALIMEDELNLMQWIMNEARANIIRSSIPSGVSQANWGEIISTSGDYRKDGIAVNNSYINSMWLAPFEVYVNGYPIKVRGNVSYSSTGKNWLTDVSKITLAEAPLVDALPALSGSSRDDLVFLEAFFVEVGSAAPADTSAFRYGGTASGTTTNDIADGRIGAETTRRVQLRWRLRTQTGVDFNTFPDGISKADGSYTAAQVVTVQGANSNPLVYVSGSDVNYFFRRANTTASGMTFFSDDSGLYVCGDGTTTAQTLLGSIDGYVYAMPVAKVRRRNSAGYSASNPNGARNFYRYRLTSALGVSAGSTMTFNIVAAHVDNTNADTAPVQVGDTLIWSGGVFGTVVSVLSSTSVSVLYQGTTPFNANAQGTYYLKSDRPDGLFANVIDASDVTHGGDLRHKVSLTGYAYQGLMDDAFSRLLRNDLSHSAGKVLAKDTYNLRKAPNLETAVPQSTDYKAPDGVTRRLSNLLGTARTAADFVKDEAASDAVWSAQSDGFIKVTGASQFKGIMPIGAPYIVPQTGRYYVYMFEYYGVQVLTNILTNVVCSATAVPVIKYVAFAGDGVAHTQNFLQFERNAATAGDFYVRLPRLYEIDQATYAKIDVDPEYTGTKLAEKFPYVDSVPSVVENLVPPFTDPAWSIHSSAKVDGPSQLTLTATGTDQYSAVFVPVQESTTYYLAGTATNSGKVWAFYYDNSGVLSGYAGVAVNGTFTTPTGCTRLHIRATNSTTATGTFVFTNYQLVKGGRPPFCYVPFGRWYVPTDYALSSPNTRTSVIETYDQVRRILSDAQTSESISDVVRSLGAPQRHIRVTQATEGQWAASDTVQVWHPYGTISGALGASTALGRITQYIDTTNVIVDDVSKLAVNDTFILFVGTDGNFGETPRTITVIDTTKKQITFTPAVTGDVTGFYFTETTSSSSSPTVKDSSGNTVAGTWTGLGTRKATFTVTTPPATNTSDLTVAYTVNYRPGKGLQSVPSDVLQANVNGDVLGVANVTAAKANFAYKVQGSTDAVPHVFKYAATSGTLLAPSSGTFTEAIQSHYGMLNVADGNSATGVTTYTNGTFAQHLFGIDMIRLVEDKYGELPGCVTVADKVAWLVANLNWVYFTWYGAGAHPTGNAAYVSVWRTDTTVWDTALSHTNATSTRIQHQIQSSIPKVIDSNGMAYVTVYTDAANGTLGSSVSSDYMEAEIELKVTETFYTTLRTANPYPQFAENLLSYNQAFPIHLDVSNGDWRVYANAALSIASAGVVSATTTGAQALDGILLVSGITIDSSKLYTTSLEVYGSGTIYVDVYRESNSTTFLMARQQVTLSSMPQRVVLTGRPDATGTLRVYLRSTTAQVTTINVQKLKAQEGVVQSPVWTPGCRKRTVFNFLGKLTASTFENTHKMYEITSSTFANPPTGTEPAQWVYDNISKTDAASKNYPVSTTGAYAQHLFEFDLSQFGMSLDELKKAIRKITLVWSGFGSGDSAGALTYGATVRSYAPAPGSGWSSVTTVPSTVVSSSTVTIASSNSTALALVTSGHKVYVNVSAAYPASATNQSSITTDYVALIVDFAEYVDLVKSNVVKVRPETKEIKLFFPAKSRKMIGGGSTEDVVTLSYRSVPYQGLYDGTQADLNLKAVADRIIALSDGTGAVKALYNYSPPTSPATVKLPAVQADYSVVNDKLFKEGTPSAATRSQSSGSYLELPVMSFDCFSTVPSGGTFSYIRPSAGLTLRLAANNKATYRGCSLAQLTPDGTALSGWALYGDPLGNKTSTHVTAHCMLGEYRGELYLIVTTNFIYDERTHVIYLNGACDFFRIPGRPIIKQ